MTAVALAVLMYLVNHTTCAMRATAENPVAALMGVARHGDLGHLHHWCRSGRHSASMYASNYGTAHSTTGFRQA